MVDPVLLPAGFEPELVPNREEYSICPCGGSCCDGEGFESDDDDGCDLEDDWTNRAPKRVWMRSR